MTVYVVLFSLILIESAIYMNYKQIAPQSATKAYTLLFCIELILVAGFRSSTTGADTQIYLNVFNYYKRLPRGEILFAKLLNVWGNFEAGYFLFLKILAWLQVNDQLFLIISAAIIYIPVVIFFQKYSPFPNMSFAVYSMLGIYAYSMGIMRQMMALAIFLCSLDFIFEKKFKNYMMVIILAIFFHSTAIVLLPVYWIVNVNRKTLLKIALVGEVIGLVAGRTIILIITRFMPKYARFLGRQYYDTHGGTYSMLFLLTFVLIITYLIYRNQNDIEDIDVLSFAMLSVGVVIQAISYSFGIMGRMIPYFSIFAAIEIPRIIHQVFTPNSKIIYLAILEPILFALNYLVIRSNEFIVPYYPFWK